MKLTLASAKSVAIYVLGLASVVIGAIPAVAVPSSVHAALVVVGGVVVAIERFIQGQVAVAVAKAKEVTTHVLEVSHP